MQPAHQTLITVSIGTAILLGVAEGASAQAKMSSHVSTNESESIALGRANSDSNSLPSLVTESGQDFDSSSLPIQENYTFVEVADDLSLLEFSTVQKWTDEQAGVPIEPVSLINGLTAQTIEVDLPDSDPPAAAPIEDDSVDVPASPLSEPSLPRVDAADEGGIIESPEIEESPDIPDDPFSESVEPISTDSELDLEIESELDLEIESELDLEIESEEERLPDAELPIRERPDVSVPATSEIDDLAEELDVVDEPLIEIPDYLLAPSNPLFVPVAPETVEIEGTQPLSLAQALEISRRNSRELESALQQLEQSQEALREAKAAYLPTITSNSTLIHSDNDISNEPGSLADGLPTVSTNLSVDLTVNYDLFTSGQRSATVRAAEDAVKIQELQVEVVKEELQLSITSAYYDLQESDERVRIAEDTVEQSRISLRDALARERAGVGTRFDRLQAEVDLANDEQTLSNALRDQQVERRQLAELLSIPPGIDISAADPVEVAGSWAMSLEETLVLAYRNRAELEQQLLQRDLENQQARAARASRWPQLSIFGQYSLDDLLDRTRSSIQGAAETGNDLETLSAGLQLQWTLYNGGATRAQARQEKIAAELAETDFANTRENIRFEVEQQYLNLGANFKNIQTANSAVGLAEESLRLARLRFGAGVGIQSDVLEAQTRLTEAEVNLVTAILGYNRALVAIQREVSNFPDNNLSADPVREP